MTIPKWKAILKILWWIFYDTIIKQSGRNQEFMNTIGTNGAWIELPKMFKRHSDEDNITRNNRDFWLKYGRYP